MTPEQMNELAARLHELASLYRTFNQTGRDRSADLAAAADLIAGMAQRVPLSEEQRLEIVETLIRPVAFNRPVAIQIGLKVSHAIEQAHGIRSEE